MQDKISIMHFSNVVVRGGAEEHMLTLLGGLRRDLFRLHLACPPRLLDLLRDDLPSDVEVHPVVLARPHHAGGALQLARALRAGRIDILHSHLFYASLLASPVARLCRVPAIIETPHLSERWRRGWLRSHYTVDRLAGLLVNRYIAVSEANGRYLREEKGLPSRKVTVIQNGCDLDRFSPRALAGSSRSRAELGLCDSDPVLVLIGRLAPQKGHPVLLEALREIRLRHPGTTLVCVGDGEERERLVERVAALGLSEAVRFAGFQEDVRPWLAAADIVVLPSLWEGLPLTAIEALAAERPVVATAVDGTPEVVINEQTGLTVPPADPASLAEAIGRLLSDPGLARRLARSGRSLVQQRFGQQRQIAMTETVYLEAVGRSCTTPVNAPFVSGCEAAPGPLHRTGVTTASVEPFAGPRSRPWRS